MAGIRTVDTRMLAALHAAADGRQSWTVSELVAEVKDRLGPYKKQAIPRAARREVALRYGCPPGGTIWVGCHYCDRPGEIYWHRLHGGRPSAWVSFDHELDHVIPESKGGPTAAVNLVLACRPCNRRKAASI